MSKPPAEYEDPLTSVQQERYTRAHAGTGTDAFYITSSLDRARKETNNLRRAPPPSTSRPVKGHHVIGGKNARPMTVHAPRNKALDPNHPQNLKKMKLTVDGYVPYPPPRGTLITITS